MNTRSTSFHKLNADNKLPLFKKALWILFNFFENTAGLIVSKKLQLETPDIKERSLQSFQSIGSETSTPSPTRLFCDVFWQVLDLNFIRSFLGPDINSIEIGCGHGIYGEFLSENFGNQFSYLGVDPVSSNNWDLLSSNNNDLSFKIGSSDEVSDFLSGKNFIFTQSAIEHFDNDLVFFQNISNYVNNVSFSTFQVHTFPSSFALLTYPFHGIRQYNKRNINKIIKLFPRSHIKLISLGSLQSIFYHLRVITLPRLLGKKDLRKVDRESYINGLMNAANKDLLNPRKSIAGFYALIIQTP